MKVLFIGGNGNISWYCLKLSVDVGHEVYALNRGATKLTRKEFPMETIKLTGDIRNHEQIKSLLSGMDFDAVIDFICMDENHAQFDIELFKDKTRQFIFISSESVYKRNSKYLPFKETTPQNNIETSFDYIKGKIKAEQIFKRAFEEFNFPVTIIRPAYTYDTIIPVSIGQNCFTAPKRYLDGKPVLIAGDGTNLWTFTHSSDFANAFMGLLGNPKAVGEDFHITSDEWLTWLDATTILLDALEIKKYELMHIPVEEVLKSELATQRDLAIQKMWHNIYDNSKIKRFVPGWQAGIPLEIGIRQTLGWLFEEPVRRRFNPDLNRLLENFIAQ